MAKKKTSRKSQKNISRRSIIILITASVLGALFIWGVVSTAREQQLERENREKFVQLEDRMQEVHRSFAETFPGVRWSQDKFCNRMSTPFPADEGIGCSIEVGTTDVVHMTMANQLRNMLKGLGFKEGGSITSSDEKGTIITDYDPQLKNVFCSLLLPGNGSSNNTIETVFYCRSSSENLIYPEH